MSPTLTHIPARRLTSWLATLISPFTVARPAAERLGRCWPRRSATSTTRNTAPSSFVARFRRSPIREAFGMPVVSCTCPWAPSRYRTHTDGLSRLARKSPSSICSMKPIRIPGWGPKSLFWDLTSLRGLPSDNSWILLAEIDQLVESALMSAQRATPNRIIGYWIFSTGGSTRPATPSSRGAEKYDGSSRRAIDSSSPIPPKN
jgi:hypothetical protein